MQGLQDFLDSPQQAHRTFLHHIRVTSSIVGLTRVGWLGKEATRSEERLPIPAGRFTTKETAMVKNFPLLFKFDEVVAGNGFVSRIVSQGRVLLSAEGDGFWMYGVTPGGLAGGGHERSEAFAEFKRSYRSVLFDIAGEAQDAATFELEIQRFFYETCEDTQRQWLDALQVIRDGGLTIDLPNPPIKSDELPPRVTVMISTEPSASINPDEKDLLAEAA